MGLLLPCRYSVACLSLLFLGSGLVGIVFCQGNCAPPACVGQPCDPNMGGCGLCSPCQCRSLGTGFTTFKCHACSMEKCPCSNVLVRAAPAQSCCDGLACLDTKGNRAAAGGTCTNTGGTVSVGVPHC